MNPLDRKQFILTSFDFSIEGYQKITLSNGMVFNYDGKLSLEYGFSGKTSTEFLIYGIVIQTERTKQPLYEELLREEFSSIQECLDTCSGRFMVLFGDTIYTDACGLLGLFYTEIMNRGFIITDSLNILKRYFSISYRGDFQKYYKKDKYMFYPGPLSILENVYKLMNTQCLYISTTEIRPAIYQPIKKLTGMTNRELIEEVNERMLTYMQNIGKKFNNIYIPLSGGFDSRTVLSIAKKAGIRFKTYTCVKKKMTDCDRKLPRKLCRRIRVPHEYVYKKKISIDEYIDRIDLYNDYVCNNIIDRDREYFVGKQILKDADLVLGGACWEMGIHYYKNTLNQFDSGNARAVDVFKKSNFEKMIIQWPCWMNG